MSFAEVLSLAASMGSIVLAIMAIWLALHHKRESDRTNDAVRQVLLEVKSDAKAIAGVVLPELQKYGDAVRSTVFFQKTREPGAGTGTLTPSASAGTQGEPEKALARFYEVIESITEGRGFTNKQRDEAMALARKIKTLNLALDDEEFGSRLERLIDSFAAADQNAQVDTLADMFKDVVKGNQGIVQTLVTSLGMRILEVAQPSSKVLARFTEYEALAQQEGREDTAVPWRLVYANRAGDTKAVDAEFERMKGWGDPSRVQQVLEAIERRSDPTNIARTVTAKIQSVAQAHQALLEKQSGRLKAIAE